MSGHEGAGALTAEEKRRLLATLLEQRRGRPRTFPLSFNQERIWFMDQLAPGDPSFNIHYALTLAFALNLDVLHRSLNEVIRRHESLRTTVRLEGDSPVQLVAPVLAIDLPIEDLSALPPADRCAARDRMAAEEAIRPFDLSAGPLVRARLLRLGPGDFVLLLTMHHIVSDGWSMGIFFSELTAIYRALVVGQPSPLPPLPIQYGDYAAWQREHLRGETLARQLRYWTERLQGLPPLQLPLDHPRPPFQTSHGASHVFALGRPLSDRLEALSRREGVTTFMTLLAAFKLLLSCYTGQEDIGVGSYVANRTQGQVEGLIGFFVNTLVFRTDLSGDPPFTDLLQRVRETVVGGYTHQDVPFTRLVAELAPARDMGRNPLFQVVFQLFKPPTGASAAPGPAQEPSHPQGQTAIFDLAFNAWEAGDGLSVQAEFNTDLFDAATVVRMAEHFRNLLEDVAADAGRPLSRFTLLSGREVRQQVEEWNRTDRALPDLGSVVEQFERRVDTSPGAPAFVLGDTRITYAALDERANRIAARLIDAGVRPGDVVGVCLERSFDLPAAMLAVFKAGGVYLPLEPEYPAARLVYALSDSGARCAISNAQRGTMVQAPGVRLISIDDTAIGGDAVRPHAPVAPDDLAYLIYTSGSTGRPKGVAAAHRQILNRLAWMWREYPFAPGEVACHKTAISFVDSLWELLGGLLQGTPTAIMPAGAGARPDELIGDLAAAGVTRLWVVPSLLRAMLDVCPDLGERLPALTFWVASGEALDVSLLDAFRRAHPAARLFNLYGASEFWDATWYDATTMSGAGARVPIGTPIDNMQVYVLGAQRQLLPVGSSGQLYVSGAGLAQGYVNRAALTHERFVELPFCQGPAFATGDLVRWRQDGTLEYLGRTDEQVKIRGFRIDPIEVEIELARHDAVRAAAVVARPDAGGALQLHAFVVSDNGQMPGAVELRRFLQSRVPEFMVPATFTPIETLPETPSGKLDRLALRQAETAAPALVEPPYVAPRTEDEEEVARVWADVLGRERIGVHANFFDYGGHSLLATQVVSRLRTRRGVDLPLRACFEHPTLEALAAELGRRSGSRSPGARPRIGRVSRDQYRLARPVP